MRLSNHLQFPQDLLVHDSLPETRTLLSIHRFRSLLYHLLKLAPSLNLLLLRLTVTAIFRCFLVPLYQPGLKNRLQAPRHLLLQAS